MTLETRPVGADELRGFFTVLEAAFGEDSTDEAFAVEALTAEPERTLATFEGDEIVATAGAFTFEMTVPGGCLPCAGVTYVSVSPTHRRRGLLTALMRRQLDEIHDRGEPIAALWASEAAIYGRFGYGVASSLLRVEVDRVDARVRADAAAGDVRLRLVPPGDAAADIESIEAAILARRPGQFLRDKRWIEQILEDPPSRRGGLSQLRCLVAHEDGEVSGYALYRTKNESLRPHMLPDGTVLVFGQAATTTAAYAELSRALLAMDLMRRVRWWNLPLDTPLPHLLADPRHARTTLIDGLHVRVVDLPAALAGRRYATPVDVVLEVDDPLCRWNAGRWRLRGDRSGATCERTEADAHLRLPAESLGAAYLGGTSLRTLAAAGRVAAVDDDTLAGVSTAFGWDVAPWCPVIF